MPSFLNTIAGQIVLATLLGLCGIYLLLPKARRQSVGIGTFLCLASVGITVMIGLQEFGDPSPDLIGQILFWMFSAGAVIGSLVMIANRNPARGAMAFAFVILSTCGLFLLLGASFLMAVTVIVYMGAIIVTFLFVLMLSNVSGPTDENDRTREPLLGSLGGFGFFGLLLFALHQGLPQSLSESSSETNRFVAVLPKEPLRSEDRIALQTAYDALEAAKAANDRQSYLAEAQKAQVAVSSIVGGDGINSPQDRETIQERFAYTSQDPRTQVLLKRAESLLQANIALENALINSNGDQTATSTELKTLQDEIVLMNGIGHLPAKNVSNLAYILYSEHLLAIEMACSLLLVATIGAVLIVGRKDQSL